LLGSKEGLHEFPEWWLDSFPLWSDDDASKNYLAERMVSKSVATALDIRFDSKEKRVCFPIRGFSGALYGLHGRAISEETDPRYRMYLQKGQKNPIIWLGESWVDTTKPVVFVEGPFDLASVYCVYRNVVSPLYSNPSEHKLRRMGDITEIVTFYDRGTGGDVGRKKVEKVMIASVVTHVLPSRGKKDPGEMGIGELVECLAGKVPLDDFLLD
jgi:hypothetical protein